jgi:hypothetical protein
MQTRPKIAKRSSDKKGHKRKVTVHAGNSTIPHFSSPLVTLKSPALARGSGSTIVQRIEESKVMDVMSIGSQMRLDHLEE